MCCHVRRASASRRRRRQSRRLTWPPLPVLATLDLSQPAERQAHDFLCRATSKHDRMWKLLEVRRQGDWLLCVVRWLHPDDAGKPYSLAEVGLKEMAVYRRNYATAEAARAELERRCAESPTQAGNTRG